MILPGNLYQEIVEHAERESPFEACGILLGKGGKVEEVVATENESSSPQFNYSIPAREILKAHQKGEEKALDIIGFYHSHPHGSTLPSGIDHSRATWEGGVYLIVNQEGEIQAWRWEGKKFKEEELTIV